MGLLSFFKKIEPNKKDSPFLHTTWDAFFTFLYASDHTTHGKGTHIKDGMDLKRTMIHVVIAMQLCYVFGTYNIGHQHFAAQGLYETFMSGFHLKLAYGLIQFLPIFIVSNAVGLGIEFFYAAKRGHSVEEGYLVTGALIPLIVPPDINLWILSLSIVFAVIIGKEAFGGTGMNILNIALLSRVFLFFAYPGDISGDHVWVSTYLDPLTDPETGKLIMDEAGNMVGGAMKVAAGSVTDYSWWHTGFFNGIFESMGWSTFADQAQVVDGFTGATPLALAAKDGWEGVTAVYSPAQMFWGGIPGSIGESCKPFIIVGALILVLTKIASWRVMVGLVIGAAFTGMIFNAFGEAGSFLAVPWYYQFYMGSLLFAMAFMATDPVTAASTQTGKWIYGIMIGVVGMIVRVLNPAYPEGWMLAILFMNVFAPMIDYYVLEANVARRAKKAAALANA